MKNSIRSLCRGIFAALAVQTEIGGLMPRISRALRIAPLALCVAFMASPALAEDFFLCGNDATEDGRYCSSLDGSGTGAAGWTNAAGTVSSSMTAGNSYFVLADRESYLINSKWGGNHKTSR